MDMSIFNRLDRRNRTSVRCSVRCVRGVTVPLLRARHKRGDPGDAGRSGLRDMNPISGQSCFLVQTKDKT